MNAEELAGIEARAEAATPGPWTVVHDDELLLVTSDRHGPITADMRDREPREVVYAEPVRGEEGRPDAAFIAAARTDVPRLGDEVARLTERLEAMRSRANELIDLAETAEGQCEQARSIAVRLEQENAHQADVNRGEVESLKVMLAQVRAALEKAPTPQALESAWQNAEDWHLTAELLRGENAKLTAALARIKQMTDSWNERLPEMIVREVAVDAIQSVIENVALDGSDQPAKAWTVPKIDHDEARSVTPIVWNANRITTSANEGGPEYMRHFAAQILAACDAAKHNGGA